MLWSLRLALTAAFPGLKQATAGLCPQERELALAAFRSGVALPKQVSGESARACSYYSSKQVQKTLATVLAAQFWPLRVL